MNPLRAIGLLGLILLGGACAIVGGEPLPPEAQRFEMCLERHPKDDRNIAALIENALRQQGYSVSVATQGECDPELPLRVGYVDNFTWDMRVFLYRLTVEVFDSRSGESLAIGESFQGTFAALGDSYVDVVDRAVLALLGKEAS